MQPITALKARMISRLSGFLDGLIVLCTLLIVNSTATTFTSQFPDFTKFSEPAWMMVGTALFILFAIALQIKLHSLGQEFLRFWKNQKPLIIFVIFCAFTLLWSTYELASLYEFSLMLFAILAASYFVIRFPYKKILSIIYCFGAVSIILSVALLITLPDYSRLNNVVFNGAWRGIFWHRNHMGSLMAFFSTLYLYDLVINWKKWRRVSVSLVLLITSSVLVFGSWSATGIIIFFVLNAHLVLALLWLRYRENLNRRHYLIILGVFAVLALGLLLNLDLIFRLLQRSSTLTGRTPIWEDMLVNLWPVRPLFGYGFGAIWNQDYYRVLIQTRHYWAYEVFFGDNGFIDILLNTGLIGLGLFLYFFGRVGIKNVKLFIQHHDLDLLPPALIFIYVLWANISYSFLCEVDQFVWLLLVLSSFLPFKVLGEKTIAPSKTSNPQP